METLGREGVIVNVHRHLVLVLEEMNEGVKGSRVVIEDRHHKFPQETERGDFPRQW